MQTSENIENISKDFVAFQKEVENPKNTAENPFHKNKYAPLDTVLNTVRPIAAKHNLSIIQNSHSDGDKTHTVTMLLHSSGEWIKSDPMVIPIEGRKGTTKAQAAGIAITYSRRYQLSAMLGISSEDDNDGNLGDHDQQNSYNKSNKSNKSSKSKNKSNNYNNQAVKNPAEYKMPFGQKEGTRFKNLDLGYIKWVAEKMDPRNELGEKAQKMAKKYLAQSNNNNQSNNKKDHDYISQMNQLIKGHNELWKEVKDYLNDTVGDSDVKNINNLSEKQFEDLKLLIRGMIPGNDEERVNGEEVPDDEPSAKQLAKEAEKDIEVPF